MSFVGATLFFSSLGLMLALAQRISSQGLLRLRRGNRSLSQVPSLVRSGLDLRLQGSYVDGVEMMVGGTQSVFSEPLHKVKGVGKKTVEVYDQLGIQKLGDLLLHLPTSVIDRRQKVDLDASHVGQVVSVEATVDRVKEGNRGSPYIVSCRDKQGTRFGLTFFLGKTAAQYAWIPYGKVLTPGANVIISGKLGMSSYTNNFEIINPDLVLNAASAEEVEEGLVAEPIYGLTAGLTGTKLRTMIKTVLDLSKDAEIFENDWISEGVRQKHGWASLKESFHMSHHPEGEQDLLSSRESRWTERIAFDELVSLCVQQTLKDEATKRELAAKALALHGADYLEKAYVVKGTGKLTTLLESLLPFELTSCQVQAAKEILAEMSDSRRMARCVQGDVGSGKTLVAIMGMLHCVEASRQSALLAPTEILATQHFATISGLFSKIREHTGESRPNVRLITGALVGKKREELLREMRGGEVDVVVGTHALLTDSVADSFSSLGLVVIDEEQRFGVSQRDALADRTNALFTTATPIPRSLMLLVQDAYSVSTLTEKPPAKRLVQTVLVGMSLTDKVVARIQANIDNDTKAFWVTPCLSPSANMVGSSVQERYHQLNAIFPGRVAMLHGQMSAEEKAEVMAAFSQVGGSISVLVSTTVVEVGVDVPDASICVIERAEQFGLSQMHQIRGRIGRGEKPPREVLEECYCVLLYDDVGDDGEVKLAKEKLQILANCNDGFEISESDLVLRGPGDVFGLRQHGASGYKVASLIHHSHLLLDAQREATALLQDCATGDSIARLQQLSELMQLFGRDVVSRDVAEYANSPTKLKSSTSPSSSSSRGTSGTVAKTVEAAAVVKEAVDPAKAYLDWKNDALEIMAAIGLDRDEEAVQALQEGGGAKTSSYASRKKKEPLNFLSKPVADMTLGTQDSITIVLDLETTGLKHDDHRIIQIAAKIMGDDDGLFNAYVLPVGASVSPFIADLTGIEQAFLEEEGMPFSEAWGRFEKWMRELKTKYAGRKVVVLAHNGRRFDYDFLTAEVKRHGCVAAGGQSWREQVGVDCFVDSLTILRDSAAWVSRKDVPKKFGQEALYTHLFGSKPENGHNAVFDVLALEEILEHPSIAKTWREVANKQQFLET
jgi:ATP-dependent DNA helicase RecG